MPKGPPPKGLALPVDDTWRKLVLDALDEWPGGRMEQKELAKKVHVQPSAISQLLKMSKDAGAKTVKTSRIKAKINEVLKLPETNVGFDIPSGVSPRFMEFFERIKGKSDEELNPLYEVAKLLPR